MLTGTTCAMLGPDAILLHLEQILKMTPLLPTSRGSQTQQAAVPLVCVTGMRWFVGQVSAVSVHRLGSIHISLHSVQQCQSQA